MKDKMINLAVAVNAVIIAGVYIWTARKVVKSY